MEGGIKFSIRELNSNVSLHREQLQQVKYLLDDDPGNSEYKDMEKELKEVIAVVEALLAKGNEKFGSAIGTNASASDILQYSNSVAQYEMVDPANLRSSNGDDADIDALLKAEATKQALKRKIASATVPDSQSRSTVKLRIKTKDPVTMNMCGSVDVQKLAKQKKIHSFKSKVRMEQIEIHSQQVRKGCHDSQLTRVKWKTIDH